MQTLLEKVQQAEEQAAAIIASAEQEGKKTLKNIQEHEGQMLADIRKRAEKKAQAIIKEHVNKSHQEVGSLKEEGRLSVEMVHASAKKNRKIAIDKAIRLFQEEYLQQ